MRGHFWIDTEIARLRSLWGTGLSTREIAKAVGVTKNAAIGKADRMGLPDIREQTADICRDLAAARRRDERGRFLP